MKNGKELDDNIIKAILSKQIQAQYDWVQMLILLIALV
jgi:hypothetical protein